MRSEEEVRTVLSGFLREADNTTSIRESEWCGVAIGILLWVLGFDTEEIRAKLPFDFDQAGGR